jgi:enoyl-[acyl-carrier protein] reductase II
MVGGKLKMIKTRVTAMFGIQHPIILAGMNWISLPRLVAAVSNAGGLGTLALAQFSPEDTRKNLHQVMELTDKPFMVNQPLNRGWAKENIRIAIQERVPLINYSLGKPWFIDEVHSYGGKIVGTVASSKHAMGAVKLGCDAIIITGHEAAAHGAEATSLVLIPHVTRLVKVPVIAAGGFYNGQGLAAALSLGAEGISMGTRFILTQESIAHDAFKKLCLKATEGDTLYSRVFDGMPGRVLKTPMAEKLVKGESFSLLKAIPQALKIKKILKQSFTEFLTMAYQMMRGEEKSNLVKLARMASMAIRQQKAIYEGNTEEGIMFCGQVTGAITDLPTVQQLVDRIIIEAEETLKQTAKTVSL